jgi:hypothetical protein
LFKKRELLKIISDLLPIAEEGYKSLAISYVQLGRRDVSSEAMLDKIKQDLERAGQCLS